MDARKVQELGFVDFKTYEAEIRHQYISGFWNGAMLSLVSSMVVIALFMLFLI